MVTDFRGLKGNLRKDFAGLRHLKLAVLGDSATPLLCQALRGQGYELGLDLEIHEADYGQIEREVRDPTSPLSAFDPDVVVLFHCVQRLLRDFYLTAPEDRPAFSDIRLARIEALWSVLAAKRCRVVHFNFAELDDGAFGHFANKVECSFLYQVRRINFELMNLSRRYGNVFINDVAMLHARAGALAAFSPQAYVTADMVFSLDFLPEVAKGVVDIVAAGLGMTRKCLILDLDNTLWGGVIGDDGLENIQIGDLGIGKAFSELQLWARELRERGVLLAVCSKNDEQIAREPFARHPDMVLRLDDFAVFVANWRDKPDNIRHIQSVLSIGLDSMVFIDDSPFEREMVRRALPALTVPELPEDPAEYLGYLRSLNLFETAVLSQEDGSRTRMYREEAGRKALESSFASADEFLASLDMRASVGSLDRFSAPRVAQLTQRSNQFNLRTVRYTQQDIQEMADSPDHHGFVFKLEDKFGDYGLISVVILRRMGDALFIDTWIMSCRVLKRGVEQFALDHLVRYADRVGARALVGEYIPTAKNGLVKDHYAGLGFRENDGRWELRAADYTPGKTFISEETT